MIFKKEKKNYTHTHTHTQKKKWKHYVAFFFFSELTPLTREVVCSKL